MPPVPPSLLHPIAAEESGTVEIIFPFNGKYFQPFRCAIE